MESIIETKSFDFAVRIVRLNEYLVKEKIGVKVRSIEINVLQRAAGHMASKTDLEESMSLGAKAVEFTELGETGFMTVIKRISDVPYEYTIEYSPVKDIANKAKPVPVKWINDAHNDVTGEFERYIKPLVEGEVDVFYKDGIVDYLPVGHLVKLNN